MTDAAAPASPLTLVETFELTAPVPEFREAAAAFFRRVEVDGLAGVRTVQFYVSPEAGEAYLIIALSSADVFDRHIDFINSLDELEPYARTVRLKQFKAFGELNPDTAADLRAADISFEWVSEHVTGFDRDADCP